MKNSLKAFQRIQNEKSHTVPIIIIFIYWTNINKKLKKIEILLLKSEDVTFMRYVSHLKK